MDKYISINMSRDILNGKNYDDKEYKYEPTHEIEYNSFINLENISIRCIYFH